MVVHATTELIVDLVSVSLVLGWEGTLDIARSANNGLQTTILVPDVAERVVVIADG